MTKRNTKPVTPTPTLEQIAAATNQPPPMPITMARELATPLAAAPGIVLPDTTPTT